MVTWQKSMGNFSTWL